MNWPPQRDLKGDVSSVSPSGIHGTLYALFFTLSEITQIPVHQAKYQLNAGGLQESTATLFSVSILPPLESNQRSNG